MSGGDDDEVTDIIAAFEHRFDALRAQLAAARDEDDGSAETRQAHVDAEVALIVALVDELEEEQADVELAVLAPLLAHDALLEIETRRRLAAELDALSERSRAIVQLQAAHDVARARVPGLVPEIAIDLAHALRMEKRRDEARVVLATPIAGSPVIAKPDVAARMELARASVSEGEAAETRCRTAVEHARRADDTALLHEATCALAEHLVAREAYEEAEELLEALPALDDALETRALLEEVWRRLGSHIADDEDEPDEPGEMDRHLRTFITKPRNFAQAIVDGGLASPERIREWSYGKLVEPAELESQRIFGPVRSFWCACGRYRGRVYAGKVCKRCGVELIHAVSRRTRVGHIELATRVVHPWYAPVAAELLGRQIDDAGELQQALAEIDLEWLADDIKREITGARSQKVANAAGKRLALVEAFRTARKQSYTQPRDIVMEIVPVVPPHGDLGCDREKVRAAYAEILTGTDTKAGVRQLFEAFSAPSSMR